ncbi:MAG: cbiJ [Clostridia bacterium]|nr:cbiJ [Clostridia bacterium]
MILVLGGTSDSLLICKKLNEKKLLYKVSVTTDYGKHLAQNYTNNVLMGQLDLISMKELIKKQGISLIIDATHPYAIQVSQTAILAADGLQITYMRYERESLLKSIEYDKLEIVETIQEACEVAARVGKHIFLSTGSKHLEIFWKALPGKEIIARVLPTSEVLAACEKIGFHADHLIAMKGPFTTALNEEMYKHHQIDLVITKESGSQGGFLEKIEACRKLDIPVIVIKRAGMDYPCVVYHIEDILKRLENCLS